MYNYYVYVCAIPRFHHLKNATSTEWPVSCGQLALGLMWFTFQTLEVNTTRRVDLATPSRHPLIAGASCVRPPRTRHAAMVAIP